MRRFGFVTIAVVPACSSAWQISADALKFVQQFDDEPGVSGPPYCDASAGTCEAVSARILPPERGMNWPADFPFEESDFTREDESLDAAFYSSPRLVQHFGDEPRAALTAFYADASRAYGAVALHVDVCSSWVSHLPDSYRPESCVGIGMNAVELGKNPRLTDFVAQDLNKNQTLPLADESVDVFTNAMSVDYLVKPLVVHREMFRKLKPGGLVMLSFSNRFFPTKVIRPWPRIGEVARCGIATAYLHYAGFERVEAYVAWKHGSERNVRDPLYVMVGRKPRTPDASRVTGQEEL